METKKSIRQIIRKQRKELDPMIWQSQTAEICRKTCELDIFREATDIYCYIDFGGEVGTRPLMLEAWKLGKTVWVPKVHGETMDFYEITSFDEREVIIPPISREIEAKVLPSLTTIMPPFIFSTYFKTIFIKIR